MAQQFERLSSPVTVGSLRLKHRMIMGPMGDRNWTLQGAPREGLLDYYLARVRGGAAAITIGASEFHPAYEIGHRASFADDANIPRLRVVTEAIHAAGVPILVQLHHGGPSANPSVSPSAVPSLSTLKSGFMASRALTHAEVLEMRDRFIAGAVRAQQAGFDGIELAGQANYLLGQFLSPRMNQRDDEYGGSAGNRMRFTLEVLRGIRERCGADFVVGYAVSADELKPGGVTPEIAVPFAVALQDSGLSYLDVRVGTHESFATSERATAHNRFQSREGIWHYSEPFKRALSIPVFCSTQGSYDPSRWEQALATGQVDVIQLAKPLLADPDLPSKVLAGRVEEVRPCVYCMQCIEATRGAESADARTYCAVNADTGAEWRNRHTPAAVARQVLVIGGGPAGLEAARVAAARGHHVTLQEAAGELGGNLRAIGRCEGGDVYLRLRDWLVRACSAAGVALRTSTPATAEAVIAARPELVIVASGAGPVPLPAIKGIDRPHVVSSAAVLAGSASVGRQVVVLGGGQAGLLVAGMLAGAGQQRQVTIVESEPVKQLGAGLAHMERSYAAMTYLPARGVQAFIGARVEEIREREVLLVEQDGSRQKLKADSVVLALGAVPDTALPQALRAAGLEVQVIGDAQQPRTLADAIHEGARVARGL